MCINKRLLDFFDKKPETRAEVLPTNQSMYPVKKADKGYDIVQQEKLKKFDSCRFD